ncbi:MAG: hypothetical protein JSW11_12075 [Candidatus Heimdallarchaeota archaeon]|nr:MAG: hypothetical protein JSW11_12075 [Candidatus Heimdallarchaeota archaeon]
MVGLKISSEEIKAIIPILGLTDDDQGKVYLSLLSLGMATLGQISLLSGLDYIKTQEALLILEGSKLAKRIPGKVGRYIALEPFLKAFFLAYDPFTLVNIRKEASTGFQEDIKQISEIFAETTEKNQQYIIKLEDDFSESLSPIKLNFNELTDSLRTTAEFTNTKIQKNNEELKIKVQNTIERFEELNKEITKQNLTKLEDISGIFSPYTDEITQKFETLSEMTNNDLEKLMRENKANLESEMISIDNQIREHSENMDEVLNQFESDRLDEEKVFNEKIEKRNSLLENLKSNAHQKKSNFLDTRQGYKEIDDTVRNLYSGLENGLNNIEPLLKSSIDDIQSRKLFKGKEEFISNLTKIDENRRTILQTLKEQSKILEDIDRLNNTLNEIEDEIVQATEIGINEVRKILDEEVKLLSRNLQEIKLKICSEFRTSFKEFLHTKNQGMKTQIEAGESVFNEKVNGFNKKLEELSTDFLDNLFILVQQTEKEFEANLKEYLEKEPVFDVEKSSFKGLQSDIDELSENSAEGLKSVLTKVTDLENKFDVYVSGLKAFTANFANAQSDEVNLTLNRTKEILNSQITKVEQQLEHEISALSFSIKEMKQKLNKISELSQAVDISDIEPSFLSTDLVIGETAIIMMLRDLTLRAKASLTILMPRPELQTLITASKLPTRTRISIIGDFRKVPESTLKKILSSANVRLKQLDTVDFWGCIRDSEELLVCPEPKHPEKEGLIGVITANENLVELFSQELMTYTTRSREIVI